MQDNDLIQWHNDGHIIKTMLNKSLFLIDSIVCPNKEKTAECYSEALDGCIVSWFLNRYGFECNVGIAPAAAEMEIAWTLVSESNYDLELCQVWIIPTEDSVFSAWLATQKTEAKTDDQKSD